MFPVFQLLAARPQKAHPARTDPARSPRRIRRCCCRGGISHGRRSSTAQLAKHGLMEDHMTDLMHDAADVTPRRGFFTRVAGAMALGLAGFVPTSSRAQ